MNLSRKHGKHTWRRHKVVCVSARRHRSAQALTVKCILLLKKNHSPHSCLFWLSLPHWLLSCLGFFFFDRTRRFCMFSYVCHVPRRDLCPPPPFFLFFFSQGCIEPKSPMTMQSDTSLGLRRALLSQLPNTSPRWQRGHDECYKSLTSEPPVHTLNMPWFFSNSRGSKLQNLRHFTSFSTFFHLFTKPFYRSLKITFEAYVRV